MAIDTLEYVKHLEAAGVPRQQAEAHAQAIRHEVVPQLATKSDLDRQTSHLESKIETTMWKHTAAIIFGMIAVGGFLLKFAS